jgi:tetratricopeptide (TPR) repeat protein
MLGLSYFKAGKYDNAYYPMLLVTELDPNHAEAFFHVGRIKHLNLNKYYPHSIESLRNSVIEDYSKAIELNPKHYEAIKYRGKLYFDNGKYAGEYEKALQAFEAISSHYSKDCEFLIDFGDTYYNLNRYESAIKVYDQVLEDKHFKNNIVQDNYSDLFDEYKKNKKKLLENPENIEANYYFAGLYYHSDQYEKSLVLLNKVIEIDQDESRAYYYRGRCYFTSHPEKALLDFYKTLEIMHKYKQEKLMNVHSQSIFDYIYSYDIYEWLSRCYLDLQKHREALLYFNKFIENGGKCNKFHIMDIVREISLNTIRDEELPKIHKYLNQLFTILPCTKCNDKNFKVLRPNTSFDGLEIECTVCKKKIWVKTDKTIPDEYIESIKDWISLEKAFEIIISSNYEAVKKQNRLTISSSVRQEVWRRDEGKCVNCGSRENLEYDHIIPVSKGGSNTVRNIELLCEKCNREKTSKIQ